MVKVFSSGPMEAPTRASSRKINERGWGRCYGPQVNDIQEISKRINLMEKATSPIRMERSTKEVLGKTNETVLASWYGRVVLGMLANLNLMKGQEKP